MAYDGIITANTGAMVDPAERKRWITLQRLYEGISRVSKVPVIGPWLWRTYDRLQAISPHYPFRDLSKPSLGSMRLDRLMSKGFGGSVVEHTRKREDLPLLTTFFAVALAADRLVRKDVFAKFNQLLHEKDVLWTKPSELCFYPALGIPLIMSAPLGHTRSATSRWCCGSAPASGRRTRAPRPSGSPTG